ncbi:MAG: arsenate reductase ArsC [Geminicoccaceae bacterium]|nr:arsenate reductase ArsC [Geminicoccaceae bacterium]MCX7628695.1 arsenate reductase ArsC [Geminicoccaceae bacterium]MDW8123526.1 arsenate reductase ArsC [Geminicoccaceae bacterium]MDW8339867.1 arsenate reductase ArsC [Geminicoccaceae bacterium]
MSDLPASVLFVCSLNSIRSPMAEAILKSLHGRRIFVQSAGVRRGELDPLAVEVMDELGLDLARHRPKTLEELEDGFFDLVVTLSPEAHHRALEMTRESACEVEFWRIPDPSLVEGSREQRLAAYRAVRDLLLRRIRERFPPAPAPAS